MVAMIAFPLLLYSFFVGALLTQAIKTKSMLYAVLFSFFVLMAPVLAIQFNYWLLH